MRLCFRALAFLAAACFASAALPADAPATSYAILSLIGDSLTIVTYAPAVGSRLDSNTRQTVPLDKDDFNRVAETTAEAVIRRVRPDAKTITLTMSDPVLTGHNEDLIDSADRVKALVAPIAAQLGPGTRWMLLVTKHNSEMRLPVTTGVIGAGKLSGLGFYIDRERTMTQVDTGASGRGFLAPYAYLSVSLVDLSTGTIVRTQSSDEANTISSARSATSTDPWQALSGEEKMQTLQRMVRHAVEVNATRLLAPA